MKYPIGNAELSMQAIFWSLVIVVLLSPLPLGAIDAWSWGLLGCTVALLLGAWAGRISFARVPGLLPMRAFWPAVVPFGLAVAWILVQLTPWTPGSWHHPNWELVGQYLNREAAGSISINPAETGSALFRLLTFAGIFWLSAQLCRSRDRAKQVIYAVAIAAFVYSAYGLVVQLSGSAKILWMEKLYYRDSLTSTFFYKNAFATFAGFGLVCAIALLLMTLERAPRDALGRRERLRLSVSHLLVKGGWQIMAVVVITCALLLSNSRGGFVATLLGLAALYGMTVVSNRASRGYAHWLAGAVAVLGLGFVAIGGGRVVDRMGDAAAQGDIRSRLFELSVAALQNDPWRGTGYGTFSDTIQTYRTSDIPKPIVRAHNTYVDNAVELGIPAAAALFLATAALAGMCFRGVRRRNRDTIFPRMGVAVAVLAGTHAALDFTLEVPAVAATFCLLMGCAVGQSWRAKEWRGEGSESQAPSVAPPQIATQQV